MIKKWILLAILCTVLIWVPVIANARREGGRHEGGRGDGDFLPGFCLGGALGGALGCMAASRPMEPPPPPPPPMCYREVPGHWEERWNPNSGYYERVWIPPHTERYP
ncbi:MAG: hypothetical protein OEW45_12480, partial [Deltaproteobacteria bacterium]|nr:hypothetical protein [Deltaproteobacteria bacterium]